MLCICTAHLSNLFVLCACLDCYVFIVIHDYAQWCAHRLALRRFLSFFLYFLSFLRESFDGLRCRELFFLRLSLDCLRCF